MTLVIPPGFAQVAWRFTATGDAEPMITTCGRTDADFEGDAAGMAETLANNFQTAWPTSSMSEDWKFIGVVVRLGQDFGPPVVGEAARNIEGISTQSMLPSNCSVLVRKGSNIGGRSGRGRMFIPPFGLQEAQVDSNGYFVGTAQADYQDHVDDWLTGDVWRILHDSAAPGAPAPTPISQFVVDRQIATQRRRMRH